MSSFAVEARFSTTARFQTNVGKAPYRGGLLFDNGPHPLDHSFPFSHVLEIDRGTKQIVWKYQEVRVWDFFSPRISVCRTGYVYQRGMVWPVLRGHRRRRESTSIRNLARDSNS